MLNFGIGVKLEFAFGSQIVNLSTPSMSLQDLDLINYFSSLFCVNQFQHCIKNKIKVCFNVQTLQ